MQRCAVPIEFNAFDNAKGSDVQQVADYFNTAIRGWQDAGWRFCHLEPINANKHLTAFGATATVLPIQLYVAILERD